MNYKLEYNHKLKDFEDIWNIENEYLEISTISSVEQTIKWNKMNSDTHIFVRDIFKDRIVGEITLLPLNKEQFDKFISDELDDTEINNIISYKKNIDCYLLFSTIAIDKEYRNEKVILSLLLQGLNQKLDYLINKGINFLNMCAMGETNDGQKFIEGFLNLKYIKDTKDGYKLYSFKNQEEFNNWKKIFPNYIKKYQTN